MPRTDARHRGSFSGRVKSAGRRVSVAINGSGDERLNLKLAPGEYYVQAIYSYWLIPVRPRALQLPLSPEPTEFRRTTPLSQLGCCQNRQPDGRVRTGKIRGP